MAAITGTGGAVGWSMKDSPAAAAKVKVALENAAGLVGDAVTACPKREFKALVGDTSGGLADTTAAGAPKNPDEGKTAGGQIDLKIGQA